jgi:predicted HAD superfamily phosphohydrolase YqeG
MILRHFNCNPSKLIIGVSLLMLVGDRLLTDILFGRVHGLYSIKTEPFATEEAGVRIARALEEKVYGR